MVTLAPEIESKYEILQKMGEGGMGAVYKVRHRFLDEVQVVKLMQAKFSSDSGLRERFLREAKTAKQLRHPNIAEVIDFSITTDGTAYIVMEFIEGVNMRDVLTRAGRPLDPALVVSAGQQALRALGFLHRKKFVHRDISPDNLMLTHDDEGKALVKLIDLGITKSTEDTDSLTMAGQFVGKIHYASPEQFGGKVDGRSDLYSFGVVLYELLTAKRPIDGRDYLSVIAGHTSHPPRPFTETDPHERIPPQLRNVVLKALEKAPADRYQTADEFAAALAAIDLPPSPSFSGSVAIPADGKTVVETTEGSGEGSAWRAALEENSVGGWEAFLQNYPKSNRAGEAKRRIEEIEEREEADWQKATQSESSDAVRAYLEKHGESTRAGKARRLLEKFEAAEAEARAWEAASQVDAVTGWEVYLSAHQESTRAADARKRLEAAKRRDEEGRAWKLAEASDSVGAWREYLKHCGDSPRAAEANKRLKAAEAREVEDRAWNQAVAAASAAGWEAFVRAHPNSSRAQAARSQLADLSEREAETRDWTTAANENTTASWQRYINQHPRSPRLKDAAHRRQEAVAREDKKKREAQAEEQRDREAAARQEEARRQAAAEDIAWKSAAAGNSLPALQAFLEKYPQSRYAGEARIQIGQIEAEQRENAGWERATATGDADVWRWYIAQFPQSKRINDARKRLKQIEARARETTPVPAPLPLPEPRPTPAPITQVDDVRVPQPEPSPWRKVVIAAGALVAVAAIIVAVLMMRPDPDPVVVPQPGAGPEIAAQPGTNVDVVAPTPAPSSTPGRLVINAAPWAEVKAVKGADGTDYVKSKPAYTPLVLTLPAGSYTIELTNPNAPAPPAGTAQVKPGATARYDVEIDMRSADAYLDRLTRAKK